MKNTHFRMIALLLGAAVLTFSACKKDEDKGDPPTIVSVAVANDNATVLVTFNEVVYKADNQTGNLDKAALSVTVTGGVATLTDYTVTHIAGTNEVTIGLTLSGIADGTEVLTVKPAAANAIYNAKGAAMEASETKSDNLKDTGIIGKWNSAGVNLAPLLVYAGIDSIYANFKGDNSYVVESFTPDGSKTTLTGTFTQQRSTVPGIWNITVNQSAPTALTSVGIFQVLTTFSPLRMKYEIAQTEPAIVGVTPPTAEGGFGSTSGGAYGVLNVQTYVRMN
jgi:hypothetical protein